MRVHGKQKHAVAHLLALFIKKKKKELMSRPWGPLKGEKWNLHAHRNYPTAEAGG